MRNALTVVAGLCLMACHTYSTVPITALPPESSVRLYLNDAGRSTLATQVGPYVEYLQGTVTSRDTTGVTMKIRTIQRFSGPEETYPRYDPVIIPDSTIASVGVRKVATARSVLLAGAIAAGSVLVFQSGDAGASNSGSPTTGGSSSGH